MTIEQKEGCYLLAVAQLVWFGQNYTASMFKYIFFMDAIAKNMNLDLKFRLFKYLCLKLKLEVRY